jgi:hypothetical protein
MRINGEYILAVSGILAKRGISGYLKEKTVGKFLKRLCFFL